MNASPPTISNDVDSHDYPPVYGTELVAAAAPLRDDDAADAPDIVTETPLRQSPVAVAATGNIAAELSDELNEEDD